MKSQNHILLVELFCRHTFMNDTQKKLKNFIILFLGCILITSQLVGQNLTVSTATSGNTYSSGTYTCGTGTISGSITADGQDMWICICPPAGSYAQVTFASINLADVTSGGSANDDYLYVYQGCGTSGTVLYNPTPSTGISNVVVTATLPNTCITVRLLERGSFAAGTYNFSGTIQCVPEPANNDPCGALPISVFSTCQNTEVNNSFASQTSGPPNPTSCGPAQPNWKDVWYSVTVPADGNVNLEFTAGTLTDAVAAIYSSSDGTCTGTFTQIVCDDDSGPGLMPALSVTGQTPGATLWVRLWDYNGDNQGTFSVCAIGNNGSCTPTTADCLGAIPVCSNTSYSNLASGQGCTADLNSTNDGCLAGEHNMTYYVIQIGSSGTWGFEGSFPVTSNGIEYDWALWQLVENPYTTSAACNLSAPIRCSYASQAGKSEVGMGMVSNQAETSENGSPSGDGYVHWLDAAVAGEYYLLGIDRWSTAGGAYTINFTGSATMSCDIMTVLPVVLVNFDGKPLARENMVYWTTASQTNNDYFTVEKSKSGISWEVMSTVQGMGTTADVIEYSVLDYDPFALTYYRLKQTDYDGTVKTFDPIVVSRESQESELFSELYPNPSTGDVYFNYTGSNFTEPIEVTLFSTTGGRMTKYGYVSFNNYQGLNIDCKELSNGIYSVTLRQGAKIVHKKFTIIR